MSDDLLILTLKLVGGGSCSVSVDKNVTIRELKKVVEGSLSVPESQQKILHKGRPLSDETKLSDVKIPSGATLYVMRARDPSGSGSRNPQPKDDLAEELKRFLLGYFNESDAEKVVKEYMKEFYHGMSQLNLDDYERIGAYYNDQRLKE